MCAAWVAALSGDQASLRRWLPIVEASEFQGALPDGIQSMQSSAALLQGTFGFEGIGIVPLPTVRFALVSAGCLPDCGAAGIFAVGSVACALAPSLSVLVFARALQSGAGTVIGASVGALILASRPPDPLLVIWLALFALLRQVGDIGHEP